MIHGEALSIPGKALIISENAPTICGKALIISEKPSPLAAEPPVTGAGGDASRA
jgi:hypothetical protein